MYAKRIIPCLDVKNGRVVNASRKCSALPAPPEAITGIPVFSLIVRVSSIS